MPDQEKVINELNDCLQNQHISFMDGVGDIYAVSEETIRNALELLKEQEVMSLDEFKNELSKMFSSIWDCEIDHPVFQDTVGELMSAVMQLYARAVKLE